MPACGVSSPASTGGVDVGPVFAQASDEGRAGVASGAPDFVYITVIVVHEVGSSALLAGFLVLPIGRVDPLRTFRRAERVRTAPAWPTIGEQALHQIDTDAQAVRPGKVAANYSIDGK
jgi:hypothetical protein